MKSNEQKERRQKMLTIQLKLAGFLMWNDSFDLTVQRDMVRSHFAAIQVSWFLFTTRSRIMRNHDEKWNFCYFKIKLDWFSTKQRIDTWKCQYLDKTTLPIQIEFICNLKVSNFQWKHWNTEIWMVMLNSACLQIILP